MVLELTDQHPFRPFLVSEQYRHLHQVSSLWKEWNPDDELDLDWFNRPRNSSDLDPDWFDQDQVSKAPEIHLDDGRILVLEYT